MLRPYLNTLQLYFYDYLHATPIALRLSNDKMIF